MAADLETGLRRTNVFLRATLFAFGLLIAVAAALFVAVLFDFRNSTVWIVATLSAVACLAAAMFLVRRYRFYRFGVEEACASAGILFAGLAAGQFIDLYVGGDAGIGLGLVAAAVTAFMVFLRFGYVYAAVIGMGCAALAPFPLLESDVAARLVGVAILALIFVAGRLRRSDAGDEFPGDSYAIVEAAAWGGIYFLLNLKASSWLAQPDDSGTFYWITYALIWMDPIAGLWIAVRERHRWLLDLNIVQAIVTMMSNKAYLGAERQPWDPIAFGILLVAVALGLRRWLSSGEGGARNGVVAFRILASERERLAAAGSLSAMQPSLHPHHGPEEPKPAFGGGRSGGAGATGHL